MRKKEKEKNGNDPSHSQPIVDEAQLLLSLSELLKRREKKFEDEKDNQKEFDRRIGQRS